MCEARSSTPLRPRWRRAHRPFTWCPRHGARAVAHGERRQNCDCRHDRGDNEQSAQDLIGLPRRPALERVDHQVVLQRPALERRAAAPRRAPPGRSGPRTAPRSGCEPSTVSAATPMAMPSMRATVSAALPTPNAVRPSASSTPVVRAVTVTPKPRPNSASPRTAARAASLVVTVADDQQAADLRDEPGRGSGSITPIGRTR